MTRWDEGQYTAIEQSEGRWVAELLGRRLRGRAVVERVAGEADAWRFAVTP